MTGFRLFDLNEPQHQAVTTTEGPLLILAGAGTGKTRVITVRVAYLIAQGIDPASILAVTFTNKAANEMRERLAAITEKSEAKKVTMCTFHSLCVRILRSGITLLGYKTNFSIYDESDQMGLIKKIIARTAAQDEKLDPNLAKNLISRAKNRGWSAPEDDKTLISSVFARYQQELKNLNAVDFDDLLLLAVKLMNEHEEVREKWRARFHYLMVDEFQDTNRLQLDLVSLLANETNNVAVVGDDDQSIYGWRGAEVSNILEFEQHFPNPTVVKLEQNYRSTNTILNLANGVIKNNPRRRPKQLWSAHSDGEKIRIVQARDDRAEAQFVAEEIQKCNFANGDPWESFAVLYRMNAQSRLIEENLRRLQIPYRLIGGKSWFDRREVKDVIAYATCLLNPEDDGSLLRIINTPTRGISNLTRERVVEFSMQQQCSVFEALQNEDFLGSLTTKTRANVGAFVSLLDSYETKINEPLTDCVKVMRDLIEEIGYKDDLKRACKTTQEAFNREVNVNEILNSFERFQKRSSEGLRGFLDELSLSRDRQEDDDKKDKGSGVTLITLHAAKGLEFPNVHLIGLEEGLLPHDRSKVEGTVDEERRLLYVGITRAMRSLTMSYCLHRIKFGSPMPCTASSFLKEFKPELIDHTTLDKIMNTPVEEKTVKSRFAKMREMLDA